MTEIKPCPFCGGEAHFETSFSGGPYVLCDECGAATMFADDEDGAAAFWHRRTPDPSLLNGLREAREALAEVLRYRHGEGKYRFASLPEAERECAAFDAWQEIEARVKATRAKLDTLLSEGGR